ncbi:MAG: trypsin-like peptidase domain-containing protein [Clostridiales bacterium]|jgi:serine protease Do|nr:trypsin-like peptidase domain-containing protein [Clostridiales bacterium]
MANDYDDNQSESLNEINRIQREIDSILNSSDSFQNADTYKTDGETMESFVTEKESAAPDAEVGLSPDSLGDGSFVFAERKSYEERLGADGDEHDAPPLLNDASRYDEDFAAGSVDRADQPVFYKESVKKGKPKGSGRLVAIVAAVCVVGSSLATIGVTKTLSGNGVATRSSTTYNAPATEADVEQAASFAFGDRNTAVIEKSIENVDLKSVSDLFVEIVNKVEPAVVSITSITAPVQSFWNLPMERGQSSGSGVIFHKDEDKVYIVTNYHVIENATEVDVSIGENAPISARLVGSDSYADLAVISVALEDLRKAGIEDVAMAEFGDSDQVKVGEIVLAIGNALGEGNTSTMGLISKNEKEITIPSLDGNGQTKMMTLKVIQTSAAINFGNSGGALIAMDGKVVGINTAKLSPASGVENMGYCIPSNIVKDKIEEFMNRSTKPFLGIMGTTITQEISRMYNLPEAGVFVNSIVEGSSAEKAGIQRTDIITSINGSPIFTMEQLSQFIGEFKVGDIVTISVVREGVKPVTIEAKLEQYNDSSF